jgi:hypothetical protein
MVAEGVPLNQAYPVCAVLAVCCTHLFFWLLSRLLCFSVCNRSSSHGGDNRRFWRPRSWSAVYCHVPVCAGRSDWGSDLEALSRRVQEAKEVIYHQLTQEMGLRAFPGTHTGLAVCEKYVRVVHINTQAFFCITHGCVSSFLLRPELYHKWHFATHCAQFMHHISIGASVEPGCR